jgi:hypothetical protein
MSHSIGADSGDFVRSWPLRTYEFPSRNKLKMNKYGHGFGQGSRFGKKVLVMGREIPDPNLDQTKSAAQTNQNQNKCKNVNMLLTYWP